MENDKLGIGWIILSVLIPLAGIIIFFVQKSKGFNNKAKTALIAAAAGFVIGVVLQFGILR